MTFKKYMKNKIFSYVNHYYQYSIFTDICGKKLNVIQYVSSNLIYSEELFDLNEHSKLKLDYEKIDKQYDVDDNIYEDIYETNNTKENYLEIDNIDKELDDYYS